MYPSLFARLIFILRDLQLKQTDLNKKGILSLKCSGNGLQAQHNLGAEQMSSKFGFF